MEKVSSLEVHSHGLLHPLAAIKVHHSQTGAATWGENPKRRRQVSLLDFCMVKPSAPMAMMGPRPMFLAIQPKFPSGGDKIPALAREPNAHVLPGLCRSAGKSWL